MSMFVEVQGLTITAGDAGQEVTLVDDVGFGIPRGEVLALIGESGSGKTSIALALLGHARRGCRIAAGSVRVGDLDLRRLDHVRCSGCAARASPTSRRARRRRSIPPTR
jgi:peptide/nickel transport system ATP-binding protein